MIDVLYFSDKAVKEKLFARVLNAQKLTLVTVLPPHRASSSPRSLQPFARLEKELGQALDQVLVVDEGKAEGMWRDPVGNLADALHPHDAKAAYAAARGYFLVDGGVWKATVKKTNDYADDFLRLEKKIEQLSLNRSARPSRARAAPRTRVEEALPSSGSPWEVLGIAPGTPLAQAKKAWKSLLTLYHPDKVAHLAPEFKELAARKTRQIMTAWEQVQAELNNRRE